ncbi:hypothetical protein HK101_010744 [Irineochytrium annulatum]|nr:hypothetical protein HK101_010744 [Irineochytrium annulatum]
MLTARPSPLRQSWGPEDGVADEVTIGAVDAFTGPDAGARPPGGTLSDEAALPYLKRISSTAAIDAEEGLLSRSHRISFRAPVPSEPLSPASDPAKHGSAHASTPEHPGTTVGTWPTPNGKRFRRPQRREANLRRVVGDMMLRRELEAVMQRHRHQLEQLEHDRGNRAQVALDPFGAASAQVVDVFADADDFEDSDDEEDDVFSVRTVSMVGKTSRTPRQTQRRRRPADDVAAVVVVVADDDKAPVTPRRSWNALRPERQHQATDRPVFHINGKGKLWLAGWADRSDANPRTAAGSPMIRTLGDGEADEVVSRSYEPLDELHAAPSADWRTSSSSFTWDGVRGSARRGSTEGGDAYYFLRRSFEGSARREPEEVDRNLFTSRSLDVDPASRRGSFQGPSGNGAGWGLGRKRNASHDVSGRAASMARSWSMPGLDAAVQLRATVKPTPIATETPSSSPIPPSRRDSLNATANSPATPDPADPPPSPAPTTPDAQSYDAPPPTASPTPSYLLDPSLTAIPFPLDKKADIISPASICLDAQPSLGLTRTRSLGDMVGGWTRKWRDRRGARERAIAAACDAPIGFAGVVEVPAGGWGVAGKGIAAGGLVGAGGAGAKRKVSSMVMRALCIAPAHDVGGTTALQVG